MGLSIHYSGSFNPNASLQAMIEEVEDIAKIYQWSYYVFERNFPKKSFDNPYNDEIYGIDVTPPGCETISLCFLSNGKMSSIVNLKFYCDSKNKEEQRYLYMLSTKTQYAGIEVHKIVIHLLKYLSGKYFSEFKLIDEGKYWETGDEKVLEKNFQRYNELLDTVGSALKNFPINAEETFEMYFERILKQIKLKKKK